MTAQLDCAYMRRLPSMSQSIAWNLRDEIKFVTANYTGNFNKFLFEKYIWKIFYGIYNHI